MHGLTRLAGNRLQVMGALNWDFKCCGANTPGHIEYQRRRPAPEAGRVVTSGQVLQARARLLPRPKNPYQPGKNAEAVGQFGDNIGRQRNDAYRQRNWTGDYDEANGTDLQDASCCVPMISGPDQPQQKNAAIERIQ